MFQIKCNIRVERGIRHRIRKLVDSWPNNLTTNLTIFIGKLHSCVVVVQLLGYV